MICLKENLKKTDKLGKSRRKGTHSAPKVRKTTINARNMRPMIGWR